MKIETIFVMERKNLGNYEHIEMSATAKVEDGEDAYSAMLSLKSVISMAIVAKLATVTVDREALKFASEATPGAKEAIKELVKETIAPKARAKRNVAKDIVEVGQKDLGEQTQDTSKDGLGQTVQNDVSPSKEEKPKATKITKYDSNVPEHKSIFGAYLAKNYGDTWKTKAPVADIKAFTASLNGKDFLDDKGSMVESFLGLVNGFFGA
jgi:hypothetical protein